jgi:hypothetical protein
LHFQQAENWIIANIPKPLDFNQFLDDGYTHLEHFLGFEALFKPRYNARSLEAPKIITVHALSAHQRD